MLRMRSLGNFEMELENLKIHRFNYNYRQSPLANKL